MDVSLATIVLWAVPVVFAITLHEAAHGYVAKLFGDQTAWMLGRVTANPIKHIDRSARSWSRGFCCCSRNSEGRASFSAGRSRCR
jgi:Zn-dependent protease